MSAIIDASSRIGSAAAGCDVVVCSVGLASFVPGLLSRLVNQLAFHPPRPSGYHVTPESQVLLVGNGLELTPLPDLASQGIRVDVVRMWTQRRNTIHGFHLRRADSPRGTILFSHGNSTDVGIMFDFFCELCRELRMDIFAYDYSGYGESSGVPSEPDLYADIDAAYHYLVHDLRTPCSKIFLCGQSIGSVPSVDLATRRDVGGVILHSGLKSGLSIVHDVKNTYWFDVFKNIEKIRHVRSPVFVIHGTHDMEVAFEHGVELHEAVPPEWAFDPWWVDMAGHNDIEISHREEYFRRIREFVEAAGQTNGRWGIEKDVDDDDDNESEHSEDG